MKKVKTVPEKPVHIDIHPDHRQPSVPIRTDKVQRATLAIAADLYGDHEINRAIDRMAKDLAA